MSLCPPEMVAVAPLLKCPSGVQDLIGRLTGRRVSESTVRFWIATGLRPRGGGPRVRLRTLKFGSKTLTTEQAILDFAAATAGADTEPTDTPATKGALLNRTAAAAAFLESEGV